MKSNFLSDYKAEHAVGVLINNIDSIQGVQSWAETVGASRSWLYRIIQEVYHKTPKEVLWEVRYEHVVRILQQDTDAICYYMAKKVGLPNGGALRMFLRRQYDTNTRELRRQIITSSTSARGVWFRLYKHQGAAQANYNGRITNRMGMAGIIVNKSFGL